MNEKNIKNEIFKYILSFLIPIFILFLNFFFTNRNFILEHPDIYHQYIPFLKYLKGVIFFENSILYSFSNGLGGSMFSHFFYYLSSPINLLTIFFKNISQSILVISTIKIGLSGLTMYHFLKSKSKNNYNLILAICYALMGYNIVFIGNYFWLDIIYMLPIVILSIDNIIYDKTPTLYILSMSFSIFLNFYISFSLCIFSFLYLIFELYYNDINNKSKKIYKFIVSSILSVVLCLFFLLPILFEVLGNSDRIVFNGILRIGWGDLFSVLNNYLVGINNYSVNVTNFNNQFNIYVSIFVLLLNIMMLFENSISIKKRMMIIIILLLFYLTIVFEPLYQFWHGFTVTYGLPYRFSYVCSFFHIYVASLYLNKNSIFSNQYIEKNKKKLIHITFFLIIYVISTWISFKLFYNSSFQMISILFLLLYPFLIIKNKKNILLLVILMELFINANLSMNGYKFYKINNKTTKCVIDKESFFRVNTEEFNDSVYCNYGGISNYTSTNKKENITFLKKLGLSGSPNSIDYNNYNTPIIDSLFSIKYKNDKKMDFYKNSNILSLGYMIYYNDKLIGKNPIEYQENLLNIMTNEKNKFFKEYNLNTIDKYNYYFNNNNNNKYLLIRNNRKILYFDMCTYAIKNKIEKKYNLCKENEKLVKTIISNDVLVEIKNNNKDKVGIHFDINQKGKTHKLTLYDFEGWQIYEKRKKVKAQKMFDNFIGVKLTKGYHKIKMKYYPKGLKEGIIISLSTLILYIIYNIFNKYTKKD